MLVKSISLYNFLHQIDFESEAVCEQNVYQSVIYFYTFLRKLWDKLQGLLAKYISTQRFFIDDKVASKMNTHNARATAEETIGLANLELQKLEEFSKEK